jgi:hypothetical protein
MTGPPILVTGGHRSGTGWVGEMLAASPSPPVAYIWEPFNLRSRPGICSYRFRHWFTYVCKENQEEFLEPLSDTLSFRYRPAEELGSISSPKDALRFPRDWFRTERYRLRRARPLMKDPIAVFSAEWLADAFDMDVVVLIRHPAAFVNSIVRKGWDHPFGDFLAQPLLMRDLLAGFEEEIEAYTEREQPLLDQATLLWNLIHVAIARFRERRPRWMFYRHEDLSLEPAARFEEIYDRLGLTWTETVRAVIQDHSGSVNPAETSDAGSHKRDSRQAIRNWKRHLTAEEVTRIRERTAALAREFYTDDEW